MGLRGYLLKRTGNTVVLILFIIVLNFVVFQALPGPLGAVAILQGNPNRQPGAIVRYLNQLGLCKPLIQNDNGTLTCVPAPLLDRFSTYVSNLLTFSFGDSLQTGKPVLFDMINTDRLGNTLLLLGTATVVSLLIGTILGVFVAARRGSLFDSGWVTTSLVTFSLPTFWMGLLFIYVFAIRLGWFPPGGTVPSDWYLPGQWPPLLGEIAGRMRHLILPTLTLTLFFYGGHLLLTRATMMEALSEDYIVTARAKGLSRGAILFKHALKNAALPLVTNAALAFSGLLGGAIITETVFNWSGLGFWLFSAISFQDLPVMSALFYLIALCVVIANFLSDIVYGVIDPRVKYE